MASIKNLLNIRGSTPFIPVISGMHPICEQQSCEYVIRIYIQLKGRRGE